METLKEEKEPAMRIQRPRGRNRLGRCEDGEEGGVGMG